MVSDRRKVMVGIRDMSEVCMVIMKSPILELNFDVNLPKKSGERLKKSMNASTAFKHVKKV